MSKKNKIIHVVGARPNFMKAAPVLEALRVFPRFQLKLVHTGQHYDRAMSGLFIEELKLPKPDLDLGVGSSSHAKQTADIMTRFEKIIMNETPSLVVVYGDVNSTMACALVCAKLGVPIAHVEAGLRSFDRSMPEEINRVVTDQLSEYLFVSEPSGQINLKREGIPERKVFFVGNTMVDTLLRFRSTALTSSLLETLGLPPREYAVLTIHRPSNVDRLEVFQEIMEAVLQLSKRISIVFPCHPRTRTRIEKFKIPSNDIKLIHPLGYLDFLCLLSQARFVLTDSGGIQEETTVLGVPCLTLRENTERPVTIEKGTNALVGSRGHRILTAANVVLDGEVTKREVPELWDGKASERIARILNSSIVSPIPT